MSERKTIQINPELFKISKSGNTKRKLESSKIEFKSELKMQKQKTLRKNVLKIIREKQQQAYKELFDNKKPSLSISNNSKTDFDKDFDESIKFFSSLANKVEKEKANNHTLKNQPDININSNSIDNNHSINNNHSIPISNFTPDNQSISNFTPDNQSISNNNSIPISNFTPDNSESRININTSPKYGCLKNGFLPTFRSFTRKNGGGINNDDEDTPLTSQSSQINEKIQKFEKIHQGNINKSDVKKRKNVIKYKKRRKIFKRTYKVGLSKSEPKIGVLVSNKTIRDRISTHAQLLKQTHIQDVRKFLIKRGFIKIGTIAPNDVLRKMFETISLVCGEIENHNPENLLYNFINDKDV
jgi:hypothetical protein